MLAKAVPAVPEPDAVDGGLSYEPKWDGFRAIVYAEGDGAVESVEIGSRGSKMLTRYFPELVEAFRRILPGPCVLDGEIVVPTGEPGRQSWTGRRSRSASTPRPAG
jgi:ATP-dependent DNA ligase